MSNLTYQSLQQAWENPPPWTAVCDWLNTKEASEVRNFLINELENSNCVYPQDPFRSFRLTPFKDLKVVILGQDPYHGPNQANGLAFAVNSSQKAPPSLMNIKKELLRSQRNHLVCNDLTQWASNGVLLVNSALTVREKEPLSHAQIGWQTLTDHIISHIAKNKTHIVFMLWGAFAQKKEAFILPHLSQGHLILKSNHPSPFSALRPPQPFIGNNHFKIADEFCFEHHGKCVFK